MNLRSVREFLRVWLLGDLPPSPPPVALAAPPPPAAEPTIDRDDPAPEISKEMLSDLVRAMTVAPAKPNAKAPANWLDPMMGGSLFPQQNVPGAPGFAYDTPWIYATPQPPKVKPGSVVSTDTLRLLANNYDILRSCILEIQREVTTTPYKFVPLDPSDKTAITAAQIKDAEELFARSGGIGGFGDELMEFENSWIEDLLVIGAPAFLHWQTLGGKIWQITTVDAATIRPCVDLFGWPAWNDVDTAYEQWVQGVRVQKFNRRELSYVGIYKRTSTPYYASAVEWLISVVQAALAADSWNKDWLVDGNTPDQLIACPENWTPQMIREYAVWFNSLLRGDIKLRTKARFVPAGMQAVEMKSRQEMQFQEFEMWLMQRTCSIFGVNPSSLGYTGDQFKGTQEASMQQTSAFGVGVMLMYRKNRYDSFLKDQGLNRIQFQNVLTGYEKPLDRATRNSSLVQGGIKTINEARSDEGLPPLPDGDTLMVQAQMVPVNIAMQALQLKAAASAKSGDGATDNKAKAAKKSDRADALQSWQRKCHNRIRRRQSPSVSFDTSSLTSTEQEEIEAGLAACATYEDVRDLFSRYSEGDPLS